MVFGVETDDDSFNIRNILKNDNFNEVSSTKELFLLIQLKSISGEIITISGLNLIKKFKTGAIIHKGDIIGTMAYFYYPAIKDPCIAISISNHGKVLDPSSFFNISNKNNLSSLISTLILMLLLMI